MRAENGIIKDDFDLQRAVIFSRSSSRSLFLRDSEDQLDFGAASHAILDSGVALNFKRGNQTQVGDSKDEIRRQPIIFS